MLRRCAVIFKLIQAIVIISILGDGAEGGEVIGLGGCPTITIQNTFALDPFIVTAVAGAAAGNFQNRWFEIRRFNTRWEDHWQCVQYLFTTTQTVAPFTNSVTITGQKPFTGAAVLVTGTANQITAADFNHFTVSYGTGPFSAKYPTTYTVVATDAIAAPTWLVLFSCKQLGPINIQGSWILSTVRNMVTANIQAAIAAANTAGIAIRNYKTVEQTNCVT